MARPLPASSDRADSWTSLVHDCFRREVGASLTIPDETVDLTESGILDSMAWVGFLRAVETASGVSDLGPSLNEQPASLRAVLCALKESSGKISIPADAAAEDLPSSFFAAAVVAGSSSAFGSRLIPSEEVDRAFEMPVGKLRSRAGIESLAYAAEGETEFTLGARAAEEALRAAACPAQQLDWLIAASETHHNVPSLAAQLHSRVLLRENCGALDVGGACLALLSALAVAQSLIGSGRARTILVVTADVHSRTLTPARVAGEFGGLFGDGASAFVLCAESGRPSASAGSAPGYQLGEFLFGCAGQYAAAIQVSHEQDGGLAVEFDGEALSRAAITRLEKVIAAVELRSRIARASVGSFATHQPNPRLLSLLAKQCDIAEERFPPICRTTGNLGSSMCGAALHAALQSAERLPKAQRRPIFLASLGPGLLFGGSWLTPL